MKTHNREQTKELTDAEFEAALHAALRDKGYFFPQNADDVTLLAASLDMTGVPTPDAQKFREFLRQETENILELPVTAKLCSPEIDQGLESLAMVARNGGEITPEIRKRMNEDRKQAKAQIQKKDGVH